MRITAAPFRILKPAESPPKMFTNPATCGSMPEPTRAPVPALVTPNSPGSDIVQTGLEQALGHGDGRYCRCRRFVSRQLTPEVLRDQDLVLALTRAHRSKIVELARALLRRTFTLRELARLLPLVDADPDAAAADRWQAAMARALRLRSAHPAGPEEDDVVDPYRRTDAVYQQMVRELTPAVDELLAWERRYR